VWHVYLKAFKQVATLACSGRILGYQRSEEAHKARSLPIVGGFAAVAAFAFLWPFLAGTKQGLGDDGFGLVRPFAGFLAHGVSSRLACFGAGARTMRRCTENVQIAVWMGSP
jgi:hypothetical protein